jgi:CopA family copper-resistance protein
MTPKPTNKQHDPITRRGFISATATAAALSALAPLRQTRADNGEPQPPTETDAITVPTDGVLDLFVEHTTTTIAGQPTTSAITVNGSIPGPTLHMREGQNVVIRVHNRLTDQDTSIHWHGLILPTSMDGVPGVSFPGIKPGEPFTYRYRAQQSGTYWYHSHSGLQEQLGHYGAIIIDPATAEPLSYDREYPLVLSDWTFESPYRVLEKLKTFEGYYNYARPTVQNLLKQAEKEGMGKALRARLRWDAMRMDPTDIADITGATYHYLMNGQTAAENWTAIAEPGQRVRLRIINASTMTYYDFRIPGLPMTVVAVDGQPVKPVDTDELRIAVAETYDVLVTLPDDQAYTLFAETMDRSGYTRGTLAPRAGMAAQVPPLRPRVMRTMADMGMADGAMDMSGNMTDSSSDTQTKADASADMPLKMDMPATQPASQPDTHSAMIPLPTENLPESIMHSPVDHGMASSMTAMMPRRRYNEPGIGLGDDPWRVLTYGDLRVLHTPTDRRAPDREFDLHLTGNMGRYIWGFDGKKYSEADMIRFVYGERLRINMINDTMMDHPIHLHGMWMDLYAGGNLYDNPRKHTVSVKPGELLSVDISADAPGQWAFHCHLLYHMDMGMFRTVAVARTLDGGQDHA